MLRLNDWNFYGLTLRMPDDDKSLRRTYAKNAGNDISWFEQCAIWAFFGIVIDGRMGGKR